jgi:hypothetical protein
VFGLAAEHRAMHHFEITLAGFGRHARGLCRVPVIWQAGRFLSFSLP